jgi:hypothetical protein
MESTWYVEMEQRKRRDVIKKRSSGPGELGFIK